MNAVNLYIELMVSNVEELKPGMTIRVRNDCDSSVAYALAHEMKIISIEDCPDDEQERCEMPCHTGCKFIMVDHDGVSEESCCGCTLFNRKGVWLHTREEQMISTKHRQLGWT